MPAGCRRFEGPFERSGLVRFVALTPLTTRPDAGVDPLEQDTLNGLALAMREVNDNKTSAKVFALFACDTHGDDALTKAQVEWAVGDEMKVPALIISGNAATLLAAKNAMRRDAGTAIVSPNATAEGFVALFAQDPSIFRIAAPDSQQASVLAQLMTGDVQYINQGKVAVIFEAGDDRDQFAQNLQSRLVDAGRDARVFSYDVPLNAGQLVSALNADLRPTASVFLGSSAALVAVVTESARTKGLQRSDGHRWLLSSATRSPVTLSNPLVATELEDMLGVAPTQGTSGLATAFRKRFSAVYGAEPVKASAAYDAMFTVMLATSWSETDNPQVSGPLMTQGLLNLVAVGGTPVRLTVEDWARAATELQNRRPVSVEGITGQLQFAADAGAPTSVFEVWKVTDGGFATVRLAKP